MSENENDLQFEKDKELQLLAARASGIEIEPCTCSNPDWPFRHKRGSGPRGHWNPLINDGDALKVAVALRMEISLTDHAAHVTSRGADRYRYPVRGLGRNDVSLNEALRRAIVGAAALSSEPLNPA